MGKNEPEVGIFWYDENAKKLFGIRKTEVSKIKFKKGIKTKKTLHKAWWQKQKYKAISEEKDTGIYKKNYTQIPRGRISQREDGVFQLIWGSRINEHIIDLVKEEFGLQNVPIECIEERIITDKKVDYLVRTLSRTKRKDYENYVVNAIWNRLNDDSLEIVTQQCINDPEKGRYFIDLYFPALNIGIECDEAHHLDVENIKADKEREVSIFDRLDEIGLDGYEAKHIDVTKTFEEVEKQINNAVAFIKQKKEEKRPEKWEIIDVEEYFNDKSEIKIKDKIGFRTREEVCNILFFHACDSGHSVIYPKKTFTNTEYDNYRLWFPHLAIEKKNGEFIPYSGWINRLIEDGKVITQEKADKKAIQEKADVEPVSETDKMKIVFAKYEDKLKDNLFRFVGIFEYIGKDENGKDIHHRRYEKCNIRKHIKKITESR